MRIFNEVECFGTSFDECNGSLLPLSYTVLKDDEGIGYLWAWWICTTCWQYSYVKVSVNGLLLGRDEVLFVLPTPWERAEADL